MGKVVVFNDIKQKSLQTTILTDGVRKHRQTAEQYIQVNEGIEELNVQSDHIHMLVSIPPKPDVFIQIFFIN